MDPIDPQIAKHAPGAIGALGSLLFLKGPLLQRVAMLVPGIGLSYWGAATVAAKSGLPEGLAGFLVGLLGMAAVSKVVETWQQLELGALIQKWLAKLLRVGDDAKTGGDA